MHNQRRRCHLWPWLPAEPIPMLPKCPAPRTGHDSAELRRLPWQGLAQLSIRDMWLS